MSNIIKHNGVTPPTDKAFLKGQLLQTTDGTLWIHNPDSDSTWDSIPGQIANDSRYILVQSSTTAFTRSLLDDADAATARETLAVKRRSAFTLIENEAETASESQRQLLRRSTDTPSAEYNRIPSIARIPNGDLLFVCQEGLSVAQGGTVVVDSGSVRLLARKVLDATGADTVDSIFYPLPYGTQVAEYTADFNASSDWVSINGTSSYETSAPLDGAGSHRTDANSGATFFGSRSPAATYSLDRRLYIEFDATVTNAAAGRFRVTTNGDETSKDATLISGTRYRCEFSAAENTGGTTDQRLVITWLLDTGTTTGSEFILVDNVSIKQHLDYIDYSHMNPTLAVDQVNDRIWLAYCTNVASSAPTAIPGTRERTLWITYSDDEGVTWSVPENIFAIGDTGLPTQVANAAWVNWSAGPGNGIVLSDGTICIPCHFTKTTDDLRYCCVVYSENNGSTWQVSPDVGPYLHEPSIVEMRDGRVRLICRSTGTLPGRKKTAIYDPSNSWAVDLPATVAADLPDGTSNGVQGSVTRFSGNDEDLSLLAYSTPANFTNRGRMTLYYSLDEGETWYEGPVIWEDSTVVNSGYSCLDVDNEGDLVCAFEHNVGGRMLLKKLNRQQLLTSADITEIPV